ncbi:DUF885 domain-containing protein [Sphingosinicella microcystinivorans]|uniref:DUF885 domain-containing protein n=1 Tax=Sphingosinicella microcystinivorans TaxID=335406 RepID=UPI001357686D|nr:DUF885 domain-containing protein [Sphingosinicella microcystinivorans]
MPVALGAASTSAQPVSSGGEAIIAPSPASQAQLAAVHDEMVEMLRPFDLPLRALVGDPIAVLPPDTLEHWETVAAKGAGFRAKLEAIPAAGLDEQDRLTRDYLIALTHGIDDYPRFWLYAFPITPYAGGWRHNTIRQSALGTPLETAEQRAYYIAALKAYAAHVRSQAGKLALQADRGIRIARPAIPGARRTAANLAQASAAFVPATERLSSAPPEEAAFFHAEVAALVEGELAPAFTALGAMLDDAYVAAAPERPGLMWQAGGADHYGRLARLHTGTDLSADEIHAIGVEILRDARAELASIKQSVGFTGSDRAFAAMVDADPRFSATTAEEVAAHFRRAMERIEPVLPRYFSLLPNAPYGIERAPRHIEEGMTFGFYRSPTPEQPVGAYVYNGASPETTSYANAAALIYHELLPGHHFQIALQQENKALPLLRRANGFLFLNAFVEGWAEYAADLADEMGMYATPYERFGRLYSKMFLANRLVVDTGLNAKGWTHEEARRFMQENTFASDAEIESELLRYSTDIPGQALSYAMGQRELLRMRAEARAALGDRFSWPAFHAAVLTPGAVPMSLLDAHLQRWREAGGE